MVGAPVVGKHVKRLLVCEVEHLDHQGPPHVVIRAGAAGGYGLGNVGTLASGGCHTKRIHPVNTRVNTLGTQTGESLGGGGGLLGIAGARGHRPTRHEAATIGEAASSAAFREARRLAVYRRRSLRISSVTLSPRAAASSLLSCHSSSSMRTPRAFVFSAISILHPFQNAHGGARPPPKAARTNHLSVVSSMQPTQRLAFLYV
jgi:hypothetical protein